MTTFDQDHAYNVKDYGAHGDGVHDDSTAIQTAFDARAADGNEDRCSVFFPPGKYRVDHTIEVRRRV